MATRQELIAAVGSRYRASSRSERRQILAEFVAVTGYHRKHAIRVLARESAPRPVPQGRSCHRLYDEAVRQALIVLWEASDRICGKRLKAALPLLIGAMEQHGHLALDATVKQQLLSISAANDRPAPVRDARAGVWRAQAPLGGGLGDPAQCADPHLCRLEGSPARLLRGRHGGALRWDQAER